MKDLAPTERERRTYFFDSMRYLFQGNLDAAFFTLTLLIAIRIFHASPNEKAIFTSLCWIGGIFSPTVVAFCSRLRLPISRAIALFFVFVGLFFLLSATADHILAYIVLIIFASTFYRSETALSTALYAQNYPPQRRAARFSSGLILSALSSILFSHFSGRALDHNLANYRMLLVLIAGFAFCCSICMICIPSDVLAEVPKKSSWRSFSYLWRDKLFGQLALYFFLIGFAFQLLLPIKVEHIGNPDYGFHLTNSLVLLIVFVIPTAVRLVTTRIFGRIFDRHHLMVSRLICNLMTLTGTVLFFNTSSIFSLCLSAVFSGLGMASSFMLHSLWVTRIVPADRVSTYMSVYIALSSIRGIFGPLVGYLIVIFWSPRVAGNFSVGLILLSTIGCWRLRHHHQVRE